jgi:hypothetical protein
MSGAHSCRSKPDAPYVGLSGKGFMGPLQEYSMRETPRQRQSFLKHVAQKCAVVFAVRSAKNQNVKRRERV